MRFIKVSRKFESGGRELGKRLADIMAFDYYDSEIILAVSKNSGLDIHDAENKLESRGCKIFRLLFGEH